MSDAVLASSIGALVAIVTATLSAWIATNQLRRQRGEWLSQFQREYSVELQKARLKANAEALNILRRLSHASSDPLNPQVAAVVAGELNAWIYSEGGLVADAQTRGAMLGLRQVCIKWKDGGRPQELYPLRNYALLFLRRDIGVEGLEEYDFNSPQSLISKLQQQAVIQGLL